MQKITTRNPDESELQVAIVAVKACLMQRPAEERIYDVDSEGNPVNREKEGRAVPAAGAGTDSYFSEKAEPEKEERARRSRKAKKQKPAAEPERQDQPELAALTPEELFPSEQEARKEPSSEEDAVPLFRDDEDDLLLLGENGNQGIWPGENYAVRQQYLYDINRIMKDSSTRRKRPGA